MNEQGRNITINGITYMPINTVADTAFNYSVAWFLFSVPIGCVVALMIWSAWSSVSDRRYEKHRRANEVKEAKARLAAAIAAGDDEKTINDYQRALTYMETKYGA